MRLFQSPDYLLVLSLQLVLYYLDVVLQVIHFVQSGDLKCLLLKSNCLRYEFILFYNFRVRCPFSDFSVSILLIAILVA